MRYYTYWDLYYIEEEADFDEVMEMLKYTFYLNCNENKIRFFMFKDEKRSCADLMNKAGSKRLFKKVYDEVQNNYGDRMSKLFYEKEGIP